MTLQDLFREAVEKAESESATGQRWGIAAETLSFWKANAGNAKARRRWRRRNLPNTQRPMAGQEQWARTRIAT